MSWEEEKEGYIKKLHAIVSGIENILRHRGSIVNATMAGQLKALRDDANRLLPKLEKDEFEIAVVGLESSGKSTFTNALIGCIVAPSEQQRCTYTSTCIRSGEQDRADVSFYSRKDFEAGFKDKLRTINKKAKRDVDVFDLDLYGPATLSLQEFQKRFDSCDEETRKLCEGVKEEIETILANWPSLSSLLSEEASRRTFNKEELKNKDFRDFISSPAKAIAVRHIEIHSSSLRDMKNAIMYDVPGFNSPNEMHRKQTLEHMKNADAIIMVAKADEPSITGEVNNILQEVDKDGERLGEKVFIFANKADRANVEKNRQLLREDWIKRGYLPASIADARIVFGSASAHLFQHKDLLAELSPEEQKVAEEAYEGLKRRPELPTDGVDELRDKLVRYYNETRSVVLKRRVDRIPGMVEDIFRGIDLDLSRPPRSKSNKLAVRTYSTMQKSLGDKLERLKESVNTEMQEKTPLSDSLRQHISKNLSADVEDCRIDDEMLKRVHREVVGAGKAEQPQKVDSYIREEKFRIMYDRFSKTVLDNVNEQRTVVLDRIRDIFLSEVDASLDAESKEILYKAFSSLCGLGLDKSNVYYQSLVERFARDIFEVLIKFSRGQDRLNKFRDDKSNFLSMGVYYNAANAGEQKGEENLDFLDVTPDDSSFWRLLLYPTQGTAAPQVSTVMGRIRDLTGLVKADSLYRLVQMVIRIKGGGTLAALDALLGNFMKDKSEATVFSEVKERLQKMIDNSDTPSQLLHEILAPGSTRYQEDVARMHANYDYAAVRAEFAEDVAALQEAMQYAFIPAVAIDKAFCARQSKVIEDIIDLVREDREHKFEDFVTENLHLIARSKDLELTAAEEQNRLNLAVMHEIREILESISSTSNAVSR